LPTLISHALVGFVAGNIVSNKKLLKKFWFFSIICPILPDLDGIGFVLGIPYADFWGHRGFFHSIFFAFILSILVVIIFFRKELCGFPTIFKKSGFWLTLYFFIITASHGILDAFTSGGLGIALLSPFDNTRYFFPITPIKVSPISITAFFSKWGYNVIKSEIFWIWMPLIGLIIFFYLVRLFKKRLTG